MKISEEANTTEISTLFVKFQSVDLIIFIKVKISNENIWGIPRYYLSQFTSSFFWLLTLVMAICYLTIKPGQVSTVQAVGKILL